MITKRKPHRLIKDLTVAEISAVDRGAAPGARIMIRKRDGRPYKPNFYKIFGVIEPRKKHRDNFAGYPTNKEIARLASAIRKADDDADFRERLSDPDDDDVVAARNRIAQEADTDSDSSNNAGSNFDADDELNDNDGSSPYGAPTRHLSELADLLVTAGDGEYDKAAALRFLLYTQPGRTMAHRLASRHKRAAPQRDNNMTTKQYDPNLNTAIVRKFGIVAFAKSVAKGDMNVSEHELTALITEDATRNGTTFAKAFSAQTEEGKTLRAAIYVAKDSGWAKARQEVMPTRPTYSDETASAVDDGGESYQQLMEMAQRMADASPEKTVAQHFADIYQNPATRDKIRRETARARSRVPLDLLPGAPNPTPGLAKAYDVLMSKAEQLRMERPELSEAQAFTKVYTDPTNKALAQQERREARAALGR